MIIGIDGNEANVENRVGIGEYAFELLAKFYQIQKSKFKNQNYNSKFKIYLKDQPKKDLPKEGEGWEYIVLGPKKLWTQIGLPLYLFTHKPRPDVFFTPSHYSPRFAPMPTAMAIMDLAYIYFPELFSRDDLYQLTHWTSYSAKQAKKIFTISESSKNDIIKAYHIKPENIVVTYPGIKEISNSNSSNMKQMSRPKADQPLAENFKSVKDKYHIPDKYILFVGTIQPRKNIGRLIEAFAQVVQKNKNIDLVIVGKKGWLYEPIFKMPQDIRIEDKVHFLDFVSDEDLNVLYKNAICFVLPSLYEGFGLPVLEAMQHGCPVITSNVSSLPEAGGDACLYVDPENSSDIAKKITQLISSEKLRSELIKKGYTHLKKFSWEKAAKQTLTVLEEVANNER